MITSNYVYFIAGWVGLILYGALLVALVCWFADRLPTRIDVERRLRYRVTLVDWLRRWNVVQLANKKYSLYSTDQAVTRFLRRLALLRHMRTHQGKALHLTAFLSDFRRILRDRPVAGLLWCLIYGPPETQRMAVWLLGRCGDHGAVPALLRLGRHPQPLVRKEVARALRRLKAWAELRTMAEHETESLVLRFTEQPIARPFERRLATFLSRGRDAED